MMAEPDTIPKTGDETFDVDAYLAPPDVVEDTEPLFRIYKGSRIAVSKAVGILWKKRLDAALAAYDPIYKAWDQTLLYYNNNQTNELRSSRGIFRRGDSTENIVYSNLNVMLPAVYGKDPDIAVNSVDKDDDDFVSVLKSVINTLFTTKSYLNAKPKIKRAVGFALLTNLGVLKLDWIKKDDSVESAMSEMQRLTKKLVECKDSKEVEQIYGEIEALESQMEVFEQSGPWLGNVLPHNLIIDPYAENEDACDGKWMIERIFFKTASLVARYTEPCDEEEETGQGRNLVYKPTHKASFTESGNRDDGLGLVLDAISGTDAEKNPVLGHETEERAAYKNLYYSECYLVWDKTLRRVMLYHRDDWTWPLWVWDDPLKLTRFFPYFVHGFGMSTGGTVSVGETAYYLDQQDEINEINRQIGRIRRTIFDFFFYNSDKVDKPEAEKFINAIRGKGTVEQNMLGVKIGEMKISDVIQAMVPPSFGENFAPLFNKEAIMDSINRISNTSDALRGTQFKTNTNEAAVQSYQDSARMAVGAKIDVVEDMVSDIANSLAELCVQNYSTEDIASLVGQSQAAKWKQMDISTYRAQYTMQCVAGTTEKPNSIFKKKEAVQIAQSIGQFASAAPLTSMTIMLRVLQNAFSEMEIHPEDWDMLDKEATAQMQKGISTQGGQAPPAGQAPSGGGDIQAKLMALPPEVKQKVLQMKQQGLPDEQIKQFLMQQVDGGGQGAPPQQPQPQQQAPQQ